MQRLTSKEIIAKGSGQISVGGWIHELRDFGGLKFIILKDRTGMLQVTLHKNSVSAELMELFKNLTKESCLLIEGEIKKADKAPDGVELIPSRIEVLSEAETPVPLDTSGKIESDLSVRLDYRFLDLRDPKKMAIFRVRSKIAKITSNFFDKEGFTEIQTPKLTSAGVESGAELFPVLYFGKQAYLSQSPQIYKQMMVVAGFEKVYEMGVVFRAEKSNTTRHLTEFTGIDFEMGFIKSEHDVMDVIEKYLQYLLTELKKECKDELKLFGVDPVVPKKIPRLDFSEIRKILKEKGKTIPEDEDLDPEGERLLAEYVKEKYGEEFVFALNYPYKKRPFYHMKPEGQPNGTRSFDLIWNGVEVATGAQREHRYEILKAQGKEKGVNLDEMKDYAMLFKFGAPPHGGVGMGLDRFVQRLLLLENVKEAILLPRDPLRLTP